MMPGYRAFSSYTNQIHEVLNIDYQYKQVLLADEQGGAWSDFKDVELMQSTGLKDKNGVEIYERDVLKFTLQESPGGYFKEAHHVESVEYSEGAFWVGHILFAHVAADDEEFEVVGNKFEHPHLLEGVDEAVGYVNAFGDVKNIVDLSDENRTVVVFKNRKRYKIEGLKVSAFVDYWKE